MARKIPIFYSALLLTGVNLLLRLVSTGFQVHISGILGAEGVGLLQLVLSVGSLSVTLGMGGIRTAAMYLTAGALGKNRPQEVTWILRGCFRYSLVLGGAVGAALYFAAPPVSAHWVGDPRTETALRLFGIFLPAVCLTGCMTGYFTAAGRIGALAAVEVCEQLCYMAVASGMLALWPGEDPGRACEGVVLGSGVGACFTLGALSVLRFLERPPRGPRIPVARSLLSTALPLALGDDLKSGLTTVENLMVPRRLALFSGSATPLAAFGTVCGMVFPLLMLPASILFALGELLIPELARCNAARSRRRIQYLTEKSLKLALLYGCFWAGLLRLLALPLCQRLYGGAEAGLSLARYSLLIPMLYCDAVVDAMNKGLGRQKVCVRINALTAAMDLAGLYILLPRWGMNGYFWSFFLSHLTNFLLSMGLLVKTAGLRLSLRTPLFTLAATLAAGAGASLLPGPASVAAGFCALLWSLLTLLQVISRADLLWAKNLLFPGRKENDPSKGVISQKYSVKGPSAPPAGTARSAP